MYYQIVDRKTMNVLMTVPTIQDAQRVVELYEKGEVKIKPIDKSDHPLLRKSR